MPGIKNPNNGVNTYIGIGGYGHRNHIFVAQRDGNYRSSMCGLRLRREGVQWRRYTFIALNDPDRPAVTCQNCILALTKKEPLE